MYNLSVIYDEVTYGCMTRNGSCDRVGTVPQVYLAILKYPIPSFVGSWQHQRIVLGKNIYYVAASRSV